MLYDFKVFQKVYDFILWIYPTVIGSVPFAYSVPFALRANGTGLKQMAPI